MRILILTQWFPPEPAILIQELAQTLKGRGHSITVLTGFPNYPSGKLYPGYQQRIYSRENISGINIIRVPLYMDHSPSAIKRILNYVTFAISCTLLGFWLAPRPDVMFVYHPPLTVGFPALVLSRLWNIRFVFQIQDMWPESLKATGMIKGRYLLSIARRFAEWVYSKAFSILVISPGFKTNLVQKGVPENKIAVISNWMEGEITNKENRNNDLANKLGLNGKFNVMFAGNIGAAQALETVIETAKILSVLPKMQFVIVGDGVALPRLKKIVDTASLTNVRFLGRYSFSAMPSLFALADILLVHLKDDPLFEITIPHKVLTYLGTGKPILAAIKGDTAELVSRAGAGIVCPPEDPTSLAAAIRKFVAMPEPEREAMGERGIQTIRERFSRELLVTEIERILIKAAT